LSQNNILEIWQPIVGETTEGFFETGFDGDMNEKTTGCQHSMGISFKKSGVNVAVSMAGRRN
jgi:hypothetical protein